MKTVVFSNNIDILNLQIALEQASLPWSVLICDELNYTKFLENKEEFKEFKWIFYGSKDFINHKILQGTEQSNLLSVVVDQGTFLPWSSFVKKIIRSSEGRSSLSRVEISAHPPQKDQALATVENILQNYKLSQRIKQHLLDVCDELLMNALYDAPYSKEKGHYYDQTPRHESIEVAKPVILELYEEGGSIKVAVTDFYGSMSKKRIIDHLSRQYVHQPYVVDNTRAGAGLGLAQSFKKGANLNFYCRSQEQTTVEASFRIVDSYRESQLYQKFVIFNFEEEPAAGIVLPQAV